MKKLVYPVVLVLAALLLVGPIVPAAMAMDPFAKPTELTEADRRFGGRRPSPRPRPRPRPAPRRSDRHDGGNFAGALIGSAIGGLIGSAIAHSNEPDVYYVEPAPAPVYVQPAPVYVQPAPPVVVQPAQPVMVCDQYGNCWYEYN